MADIFISYAKPDEDKAQLLSEFLEDQGYSVWWDRNLVSEDQARKVIMTELARAKAVIVIWTSNSIASDWVQTEAGRAHADTKLVPVKDPHIELNDIPPPFNNMHTESIDNREQIGAAITAQLAKPVRAPPVWKVARYQLFSWSGVIGGGVSLFTNLNSFLNLADWARWFAQHWIDLVERFWHFLFGWIGLSVPLMLVHDVNIMTFVVLSAIGSKLDFSTRTRDASVPLFDLRMLLRWNVWLAGPMYVLSLYFVEWVLHHFYLRSHLTFVQDFLVYNIVPVLVFIFVLVFHWPIRANLQTTAAMGLIVTVYLFGLVSRGSIWSVGSFWFTVMIVTVGGVLGVMFASPTKYPRRLWAIVGIVALLAVANEISKLIIAPLASLIQ